MLTDWVEIQLFAFLAVFTRLGAAMMFLPGFSETFVTVRSRLLLALAISFAATPLVAAEIPALPPDVGGLALFLAAEATIGVFIGILARVLFGALSTAGTIIAFQAGLSSAMLFDPSSNQQNAITGAILSMTGMVLLFVLNLHHAFIVGLVESYGLFPAGSVPEPGDMADTFAMMVAHSFALAMQIAAPFILLNTAINVAVGLLARLMPQLQVFFLILPVQIGLSLIILALAVAGAMLWFFQSFEAETAGLFLLP
ncbi:MAG: flagellar biosynthetic protein FliR [Alphaproteobacteria bacterium]